MSSGWFEDILQDGVDTFFCCWPQKVPTEQKRRSAKIIAHRGHHDNMEILENTLPAFIHCLENKIWGIELDLRWTEDHYPIILHDRDGGRVFGRPHIEPSRYTLQMLRQQAPMIPTLEEVIEQCGLQIHLMIEIKETLSDSNQLRMQRLHNLLKGLRPGIDFHLMSFSAAILKSIDFVPPSCLLGIAEWNIEEMSAECIKRGYGGLTGHYLLMKKKNIKIHHQSQQKVGVGFITSPNSLWRELNREVDWIFTNRPMQVKRWLHSFSCSSSSPSFYSSSL